MAEIWNWVDCQGRKIWDGNPSIYWKKRRLARVFEHSSICAKNLWKFKMEVCWFLGKVIVSPQRHLRIRVLVWMKGIWALKAYYVWTDEKFNHLFLPRPGVGIIGGKKKCVFWSLQIKIKAYIVDQLLETDVIISPRGHLSFRVFERSKII